MFLCLLLGNLLLCSVAQLHPTICNPMDCSSSISSVHGILQARTLEWIAISYSRGSFQPRDWTRFSCFGRRILYHCATWEDISKKERLVFFYFWAQNYRAMELHIYLLVEVLLKAFIKKQTKTMEELPLTTILMWSRKDTCHSEHNTETKSSIKNLKQAPGYCGEECSRRTKGTASSKVLR